MCEREIIYIPSIKEKSVKNKRVCANCCVSTKSDEQYGSLESQVNDYNQLIDNNLDWRNEGVFYEQCSGKNMAKRNEFKKMLKVCKKRKVDIIITKSISRFSRNAIELIITCRELKELNIDVWFEVEKIKLLEVNSMFLLETLAAVAEEESRCKSQNIKWGIRKGFESGESGYVNFKCYLYKKGNDWLEIIEYEAEIVRNIFIWKLSGDSLNAISKKLYDLDIKTPTGKEVWSRETINKLLKMKKYVAM